MGLDCRTSPAQETIQLSMIYGPGQRFSTFSFEAPFLSLRRQYGDTPSDNSLENELQVQKLEAPLELFTSPQMVYKLLSSGRSQHQKFVICVADYKKKMKYIVDHLDRISTDKKITFDQSVNMFWLKKSCGPFR